MRSASRRRDSTAYNHNHDTSRNTTARSSPRAFIRRASPDAREKVRDGRHRVWCGGIIGMGESALGPRRALLRRSPHRIRIPKACRSTRSCRWRARRSPDAAQVDPLELVRMAATARLVMPTSTVRLSAGRASSAGKRRSFVRRRRKYDLLRRHVAHHAQYWVLSKTPSCWPHRATRGAPGRPTRHDRIRKSPSRWSRQASGTARTSFRLGGAALAGLGGHEL